MSLVTGNDLSHELMQVLHRWGVPKHVLSVDIKISAALPVEITCRAYVQEPDGKLALDSENELKVLTTRYNLVPAEE